MKKLLLAEIENAFLPSKEIRDAENFAGRIDLISDLYTSLISTGNHIAIIGNRGIGKTSLSMQLINVATGKNEILKKVNLDNEKKLDFLSIYFACGDNINNLNTLLNKLLTTKDCLAEWLYDIPTISKEILDLKADINAGFLKIGGGGKTEQTSDTIIKNHDMDVIFNNVISELTKTKIATDGILIIIDEYDRILDKTGIASFIKSASTNIPLLKFCIVGVAQDLQNLMKEHESAERLFAGGILQVPPMNKSELLEIIDNAERSIRKEIIFESGARDKMVLLAQGHPYIIHLIGKYALRLAHRKSKSIIDEEHIILTLSDIAKTNADPILEGRYKKAVGTSVHREIVLKTFANITAEDGEIFTKEAYKTAIDEGVENPSQYVGQLVVADTGAELEKTRDSYYRFKDTLFKAYVQARPRLYN